MRVNRRERNAAATRRDILGAGREIFAQYPYVEVTEMQICGDAGVTRGALAHHFGSKRGLFAVLVEGLCRDAALRVADAISEEDDLRDRARAGIGAFLDASTQPAYQTIVVKQAPIALGWQRRRDLVADCYGDLIRDFGDMLDSAGLSDHSAAMLVATMRGILTELALEITQSSDHDSAWQQAWTVVEGLLGMFDRPPSGSALADSIGIGQLCTHPSACPDRVEAGENPYGTRSRRAATQHPR